MRWGIGLGAVFLGGCIPSTFVCESAEQCSRSDEGLCEANGVCSYPDDGCSSGRRYSAFGSIEAGACVPDDDGGSSGTGSTGAGSTSTSDSTGDAESSSAETGGIPGDCDASCSGHGRCVTVEDAPTCACDPGWWQVGLECLEDPCETVQCYFVDGIEGRETGAGTRDDPWRTQEQAWAYLGDAPSAGDHVLFRRGRTYSKDGTELARFRALGTAEAPIVVGAYGPVDEPAPRILAARIDVLGAEHWVVRDLDLVGGVEQAPCFLVEGAGYLTVRDNEISDCDNRAFRISSEAHHMVVFRNDIHDVGGSGAIFVSDIRWDKQDIAVGSHHWVAANTIRNSGGLGVEVKFDADLHASGEGDIKVVDNQMQGGGDASIRMLGGTGWIVGNVLAEDRGSWPAIGGQHVWFEGNAVVSNLEGPTLQDKVTMRRNTVYIGENAPVVMFQDIEQAGFTDNVLLSTAGTRLSYTAADPAFAEVDRNVYGTLGSTDCTFSIGGTEGDLAAWKAFTASAGASRCEVVPGLQLPDVDLPVDAAFWQALAPDPAWRGCGTAGAVSCEGEPLPITVAPLPEVETNAGRGWAGPLVIRQHYPLD